MAFLSYLVDSLLLSIRLLLILLGPAVLLGLMMHVLARRIQESVWRLVGRRVYVYGTAVGTISHELGHALFAKLFRHRIQEMKLFAPKPDGTLGYVVHAWDKRSLYQNVGNFFIGTGPLWFGAAVLWLLALLLLNKDLFRLLESAPLVSGDPTTWRGFWDSIGTLFASAWLFLKGSMTMADFSSWTTYLYLYLVLAIGSHVSLSLPDIQGAARGLAFLAGLVALFNLATLWAGDFASQATSWLSGKLAVFYGIMVFVLVLNLLLAIVVVPLEKILRR